MVSKLTGKKSKSLASAILPQLDIEQLGGGLCWLSTLCMPLFHITLEFPMQLKNMHYAPSNFSVLLQAIMEMGMDREHYFML